MIGFIPSQNKTFEIYGDFNTTDPVEGKLYFDPKDGRLYYYSKKETRANPKTGWFPIWDGKQTYVSNFSNVKYFEKDAIKSDISTMCSKINSSVAEQVRYNQRRSDNDEVLKPEISNGDNMFTQCIKGVITVKQLTMVDLIDMAAPKLTQKTVENYYNALTKITYMRLDKWTIWVDIILKLRYVLEVYKGEKMLLSYSYPEDTFDTGIVRYDNIISSEDDPFKKIIKVLMVMENINKNSLRSDEVDDYTINNMMTTLNGKKSLSAQLFSRFIRMANLSYVVRLYDRDMNNQVFEYKE